MIEYWCNKCGAEMESPSCLVGRMEVCPNCLRRMKVKAPPRPIKARRKMEKSLATAMG